MNEEIFENISDDIFNLVIANNDSDNTLEHYIIKWSRNPQINNKINIHTKQNKYGSSLLHYACNYYDHDIISRIIQEKKELIEISDNHNRKPIHMLCSARKKESLKMLIGNNANLESETDKNIRMIHLLCRYNNLEMLKYVTSKNIDLECKDINGWKPIHYASYYAGNELIDYLLDLGVMINDNIVLGNETHDYSSLMMLNKHII